MSTVLIVEDEKHLAEGLRFNLEAEGYNVEVSSDGETALALLLSPNCRFDMVVLDVMLPGKSGFEIAAELRQAGQFVPLLMLTARDQPQDVLRGFESGADDYLTKPFELAILIARLRSLFRRYEWLRRDNAGSASPATSQTPDRIDNEFLNDFSFAGKTIDFARLELHTGSRTIRLTLMEAEFLRHLILHEGRIVTRKSLLEDVWGLREDTDTRAMDNFVVRLRKYVEEIPSKPRHLLTVRGLGYRFVAEPDK
jgi:two-component system, OmpR family, alkaline phosphatase synthesis response regulator PhoP